MKPLKISEAEWEVMNVLWSNSPMNSRDIVESVTRRKGWDSSTIRTLVRRLVNKGVLEIKPGSKPQLFRPILSLEDYIASESLSFLDRGFGGKPAAMLLHFVEQTKLSSDEIRKLKKILTRKEK